MSAVGDARKRVAERILDAAAAEEGLAVRPAVSDDLRLAISDPNATIPPLPGEHWADHVGRAVLVAGYVRGEHPAEDARDVRLSEPCCEHAVKWHHETRGCGYHGHAPEDRCPCLLTVDEALEHYVAARLADAEQRAEKAEAKVRAVEGLRDAYYAWDGDPESEFASSPRQRDQLDAALRDAGADQ